MKRTCSRAVVPGSIDDTAWSYRHLVCLKGKRKTSSLSSPALYSLSFSLLLSFTLFAWRKQLLFSHSHTAIPPYQPNPSHQSPHRCVEWVCVRESMCTPRFVSDQIKLGWKVNALTNIQRTIPVHSIIFVIEVEKPWADRYSGEYSWMPRESRLPPKIDQEKKTY